MNNENLFPSDRLHGEHRNMIFPLRPLLCTELRSLRTYSGVINHSFPAKYVTARQPETKLGHYICPLMSLGLTVDITTIGGPV